MYKQVHICMYVVLGIYVIQSKDSERQHVLPGGKMSESELSEAAELSPPGLPGHGKLRATSYGPKSL